MKINNHISRNMAEKEENISSPVSNTLYLSGAFKLIIQK